MKMAIIGARGQVGQEFLRQMKGQEVVALDRQEVDVCDAEALREIVTKSECDVLVNLAAFHHVNECESDPEKAFRVNALGAANVARCGDRNRLIVFFSSDYVFGGDLHRQEPYVEEDRGSPLNIYGMSKLAGEMAVQSITGGNALVVRTSSVFGNVTSRKGWTFPELMLLRALRGELLKVVNDQVMVPTYACDLVKRVLGLVRHRATGIYHVTNRGSCSWYEFARATLELAGVEGRLEAISTEQSGAKARRPAYSVLGSSRAREEDAYEMPDWRCALEVYLRESGLI